MRKNRRKSYLLPKRGRSRYRKLMHHKREIQNSTARCWNYSTWESLMHAYGNLCPDYWKVYWKNSRCTQYAKRSSERAIRNQFKSALMADFDELPKGMNGNAYRRCYDYKWFM